MAKRQKVEIELDGKNKGAIKAINGVGSELTGLEKKSMGIGNRMQSAMSSVGGFYQRHRFAINAAVIGIAGSIAYLIKSAIDTAESLEKMSQRVGISVESLSTFRYIAQLAGTDVSVFEKAVQRLSKNVNDFSMGMGEAKDSFEALGIEARDSNGNLRNSEQIIFDVADRFSMMEDGTKKTAFALEIFGRAGADLIPMLNAGSDGLKDMQEEARKLGLEISTNTAKQAAEFKDNMLRLQSTVTGLGRILATEALPFLNNLASAMIVLTQNTNATTTAAAGLITGLKSVITFFGAIFAGAHAAGQMLGTLAAVMLQIGTGNFAGALDAYKIGLKGLFEVANSYGDAFDALWNGAENFNSVLDQMQQQQALENQRLQAEQLAQSWEQQAKTLQNDIIRAGLDPMSIKMFDLTQKANELRIKYAGIPGAIDLINRNLEVQIQKTFQLNELMTKQGEQPEGAKIPGALQMVENPYTAIYEQQKSQIVELTELEMLHSGLRVGFAEQAFGDMGAAANAFYQAGGQRSKKAFALYKVLSIGQAAISTYNAAAAALAPPPIGAGPLWGPILAASTIALGLGNVARIASMSFGGGASPSAPPSAPPIRDNITNNNSNSSVNRVYNITINSSYQDPDELARNLIPHLKKAEGDGLG